jgi:hypothetical protein
VRHEGFEPSFHGPRTQFPTLEECLKMVDNEGVEPSIPGCKPSVIPFHQSPKFTVDRGIALRLCHVMKPPTSRFHLWRGQRDLNSHSTVDSRGDYPYLCPHQRWSKRWESNPQSERFELSRYANSRHASMVGCPGLEPGPLRSERSASAYCASSPDRKLWSRRPRAATSPNLRRLPNRRTALSGARYSP